MGKLRILYLCAGALLSGQNIITMFAGGPKVFATGMPATTVPVAPSRIAIGPQGELFWRPVSNVVVRLNSNGPLTVVAPTAVAVDGQGSLYVGNNAPGIKKITPGGLF